MQPIAQKIKELRDEINLWTSLLYPHLNRLRQIEVEEYAGYLLGRGSAEDEVSAEFAFESLLAAHGRLQDVIIARGNLWPHRKDDYVQDLPYDQSHPATIIQFLKEKSQTEESRHWSVHLIEKRTETFGEALAQDRGIDPKELFTMVCRWRRSFAKTAAIESPVFAAMERMIDRGGRIYERVQSLRSSDRRILSNAICRYLASEYIFPWLSDKYNPTVLKYNSLFRLAQIEDDAMRHHMEETIHILFEDGIIEKEAILQVSEILSRMASALNQIGNYRELIAQILYDGGQWGTDSFICSMEPVNIIPSTEESGTCREVLLAFAQGRRNTKFGLKAVMRQIREHLIRCAQTKIVIIFTDVWDPEIFVESKRDLQAHRMTLTPKTILGALVNGKRIIPQAIN